ncbi:serine/threonine-protein kinase [Myxococcota bacterium]|nr:serine/threonine-protein kinase [Myxococcota bacterium]
MTTIGALTCPQCGAALAPPSRFAREVTCTFCGSTVRLDPSVVSVARFREAHARWVRPESHGVREWLMIGGIGWAPLRALGRGALADVVLAKRARPPSEHAVVMILRDEADRARFDAKADVLERLREAGHFVEQLPMISARGVITEGHARGRAAIVVRWSAGLVHRFDDVRRAFPHGVSPEAATWMWRRTLELLAHVHQLGFVHGAISHEHLLAHGSEHGVRLVGFGRAARIGAGSGPATVDADVAASARVIAELLGGDARSLPPSVPRPLAALITRAAEHGGGAWDLREEVGAVARATLGPPRFHPLSLP